MTYLSAQPYTSDNWDDICYSVRPVWLSEVLPDYDIMATDRQQLIVGEPGGGRKTIFGIQSADYTIIPNALIREVVDSLFDNYLLQIKYTSTGEFNIQVILNEELSVGGELLQRSMVLTNSYNGKTPFSLQGQTLAAILDENVAPAGSAYRSVCQNALMGWADSFKDLSEYRNWLGKNPLKDKKKIAAKNRTAGKPQPAAGADIRKIHHRKLTPEIFRGKLHELLLKQIESKPTLTTTVYEHLLKKNLTRTDEALLRDLSIPVQLAKQAHERYRLEERMLGAPPSYWLMYNAVNYALFNSRSSLTLNDRYKLDERVFHQLAAQSFA